jgi:anti-sigma regulatory factor (Ser/Thr protein kinase)
MATDESELLLAHVRHDGAISTDEAILLLDVSRTTAQRRLRGLVREGRLERQGAGRAARYVLPTSCWERPLEQLAEDRLWAEVRPAVRDLGLTEHELGAVGYTVTEMVNNAIDHSQGMQVVVTATRSAAGVQLEIIDDGIGVFRRVRETVDLPDEVEAVFVLEKGRFTTQPDRHSGEGIFFSSKIPSLYRLESGRIAWITDNDANDTTIEWLSESRSGTRVMMVFHPGRVPSLADVFRQWTDPDTLAFDRTRTTVRLALYGVQLLSRSEARRITTGLERFRHVTIDFTGVDLVGQGFCDEVFRVFAASHPQVVLQPAGMNESVGFMVDRARRSVGSAEAGTSSPQAASPSTTPAE